MSEIKIKCFLSPDSVSSPSSVSTADSLENCSDKKISSTTQEKGKSRSKKVPELQKKASKNASQQLSNPFTLSFLVNPKAVGHRNDLFFTLPSLLPHASCAMLLAYARTRVPADSWLRFTDSVDGKKEYQHLLYDSSKKELTDETLMHAFLPQLSKSAIEPELKKALNITHPLSLHWAFLRKYSPEARVEFPVHRDTSAATVNILLSDPTDFTGAELYLLDANQTVDGLANSKFKKQFPESVLKSPRYCANEKSCGYGRGTALFHSGRRMHGVLPIESGERYTLILMYVDNL